MSVETVEDAYRIHGSLASEIHALGTRVTILHLGDAGTGHKRDSRSLSANSCHAAARTLAA